MKKLLSILAISVGLLLPMSAKAAEIVPNCDKSCPTDNGKCTSVCTIKVEGNNSSLTEFNATLEIKGEGVKITSITAGDGWTNLNGTNTSLSFIASNGAITSSNFLLATINLEIESAATDCSLILKNPSVGKEITVEIETETTVKTGATLPLAILTCGAGAAIVIYLLARKNKKLYKI